MTNWQEKISDYYKETETKSRNKVNNEELRREEEAKKTGIERKEYQDSVIIPEFEKLDYYHTEQILKSFNEEVLGSNGIIEKNSTGKHANYELKINYLSSGSNVKSFGTGDDPVTYNSFLTLKETSFKISYEPDIKDKRINKENPGFKIDICPPEKFCYPGCEPSFYTYLYNVEIIKDCPTVFKEKDKTEIETDKDIKIYQERPYLFETKFTKKPDENIIRFIEENLIMFNEKVIKQHKVDNLKDMIIEGYALPNGWENCIDKDQIKDILIKAKLEKESKPKIVPLQKRSFLDKLIGK